MTPDRALAGLVGLAKRAEDDVRGMRAIASELPLTIRIEVNNLQEVLDLLRHKLRQETLARAIHDPPKRRAL